MEVAALGLRVTGAQEADKASASLDRLTGSSKSAEQASGGLSNQSQKASRSLADAVRTSERASASFSRLAGIARLAAAAVGGITAGRVASEFATFEQGLRNVAAVSGSTAEELAGLSDSALRAAATTRFNPQQTTQALYALASSGQDASEQMDSLDNVLNLAEAGQADLGAATELTTATLNQFGLAASESQRVADIFVASIGASALNVNRLQVALRNAGPTAAALDQSLEGTTATLGILTTAFGNGERAGTGFRAILNELPAQAEDLGIAVRDANGQFRPMVDILEDLEERGVTAGQAVATFGAEAGPALAALLRNGSEALRDMEADLESNGQAAKVAGEQLDTLRGDFDALASSVSVAMIEVGESQAGALRSTTQTVTNLIRVWSGYGDTLGEQREETQRLATALQAAAAAAAAMGAVTVAIRAAAAAQVAFNVAARANPYVLIATTIAGATAAVWSFVNAQESALDVWERAQDSEAAYQAAMSNVGAANRIQEIVKERMELESERQALEEEGFKRYSAAANRHNAIVREMAELEREYHQITDARKAAEQARFRRQQEQDEKEREAKEAQLQLQKDIVAAVGQTSDPASASELGKNIKAVQSLNDELRLAKLAGEELAVEQAKLSLNKYATPDQRREVEDLARSIHALQRQQEIDAEATDIAESLRTEEEAIRESYQRRREMVLAATFENEQARTELLTRLEAERNEALLEINGSYWERWLQSAEENLSSFDELSRVVVENFTTQFGNAFEAMVLDSENFGDAMRGLAESLVRSVVNALGQMAAQWLAYQAVQLLVGKTTQASGALAMVANAQATSAQAALAAYASTAAIPIIGPAAASGAAAAATAATQPMVAAVSSAALAGIAHDGIDSIPREGTWLLDRGERVVDSRTNSDLKSYLGRQREASNDGVVVNINEAPPGTQVRQREVDRKTIIDVVVADVNSNGPAFRSYMARTGSRRRGT